MPVLRKRAAAEGKGLYVHSSPPRVLSLSAAHVKHLIRNGDIDKLEQIVLEGQGKKLVGEYSADYKTRMFLKNVPALMSKIALLHDSVNSDRLSELQSILDEEPERKKKLVMAKDDSGVGLLHKAVYYDLKAIYRWILDKFPHTVSIRDSEGRTPYFYTLLCKDPGTAQKVLISAGADPSAVDYKQHSTKYYSNHLQELELPSGHKTTSPSRKSTASKESLNFKKSNIRIWIHQRNLTNLQQVVWEGHGSKLLVEHSNNTRVKKFLEAVPFIMSFIKDVHCDVQNGDLDSLKNRTSPPVPINVLTAKDSNGLTPLHKAVGLGKDDIVEYIIGEIPSSVNMLDNDGRTPLHYAALLKDNHKMFKFLVDNGADESILDHRQKSAAYYNNRASEMDTKLLHVVPECPRGAKEPHGFDWTMLKSISASLSNGIKKASEKLENGNNNAPTGDEENTEKNEKDDNGNIENNEEKQETEESSADKVEEPNEEQNNHEENTDNEATNAVDGSEQSVEGESEQKEPEESTEETKEDNQDNDDNEETEEQQTDETPPQEENNPEESAELANTEETNQEDNDNDESIENVQDNEPNEEANDDDVQNNEETNEGNEETTETEERPSSKTSEKSNRPSTRTENRSRPQTAREVPPEDDNDVNNDEEGEGNEDEEKNSPEIEGEGVIEGVVNGEHEVEPMNNEGQNSRDDDDDDIKSIIDSGNMEQLAALVLNGEGDRLVGQKSDNQELQTFLDNVPVYMSKIHRIHMAAREGSLRDLQAALDRRKFAVARDSVSPNGASPLHVAVVFSRTSVVRYLAGRFPETVHVEDDNGRTPLHYAAVLKDNGHYYNLLLHLGADNRVKDKFGHNAEYYLKNQTDFSHRQILADFGAEDEADDILNDRVSEDIYSSRRDMDDDDMIGVLERCYHVIHGRRTSSSISTKTNSAVSTTSSSTTVFTTLLAKHLKRYVYDSIRLRITKLDHNLYDVVWPSVKKLPPEPSVRSALDEDFPMGVVAPDYYAYRVFAELLEPMIKEYNYMDVRQPFGVFKASIDNTGDGVGDVDLDPTGKWVVTGSLECTRNLSFYELPKSLSPTELEDVERLITDLLLNSRTAHVLYPNASDDEIREKGSGTYYTMNEVLEEPSEARVTLASHGLLIPLWNVPDSDRLHGRHWPYGRGVFLSNSCNLAVYVNVLDHVRIVTSTESSSPGAVGLIYARLMRILSILDELNFRQDDRLGYLSARPSTLGCGLKFRLTLKCSNLLREPDNLRQLCAMRGLIFRRSGGAADVFRVSNRVSVGVNADQCFSDFTTAVSNILQLEKDMSMSNSLHIAAIFLGIFKRKRESESRHQ
ncbi:uncharacterized protein LOC143199972 isoform X3 [Rhynchophorus ferrugineus]|uniref:uncharacterized protein LOC143199972 isoform X3 n=1 Tax=Rhynchophorus ferrugineus TaxID=354439 RepID=UPI003FCE7722